MPRSAARAASRRQVSGDTELAMQITAPRPRFLTGRRSTSSTCSSVATMTIDDLGAARDVAGVDSAELEGLRALDRLRIDVVADDGKALRRHVARHLQPHGAKSDHAGALHLFHGCSLCTGRRWVIASVVIPACP